MAENLSHTRGQAILRYATPVAALLAMAVSAVVAVGWLIDSTDITQVRSAYVPMAPSAALCFMLLGVVVLLRQRWHGGVVLTVWRLLTGLVLLIGIILLAEFVIEPVGNLEPSIEHLFGQGPPNAEGYTPGHMSPLAASLFILLAISVLVSYPFRGRKSLDFLISQSTAVAVFSLACLLMIGYWYDAPLLYGGEVRPAALPAAFGFLVLSAGLLLEYPKAWLRRWYTSTSIAARFTRLVVPISAAVALIIGWIHKEIVIVSDAVDISLFTILIAGSISVVIIIVSRKMQVAVTAGEQSLRERQEFAEGLIESMQDGLSVIGPDGKRMMANQALVDMTGLTREELLHEKAPFAFWPPEHQEEIMAAFKDKKTVQQDEMEFVYMRKNGERFPVLVTPSTMKDEQGNLVAASISIKDISERKRAEVALRESEKLLRTIADNYPNSYLSIIEKDLTVGLTTGQEFKKQNLNPDDYVGLTLDQVFGEHAPMVKEKYGQAFKGEEITFELYINDQHQVVHAIPLFDEDGEVPRIMAVVENVTERKQAEETILRKSRDLSILLETGKAFATTLDISTVLHTIVDISVQLAELDTGAIYLLQKDKVYLGASTPPLPEGFPEELRLGPLADHPHMNQAVTSRLPVTLEDALKVELSAAEQAAVEARGLRSIIYLPLVIEQRVVGVLILGTTETVRLFSREETDLYTTLSTQAAMAIENARLYDVVKDELDERKRANKALEESEKRFSTVFQANPIATAITRLSDSKIISINESWHAMTGYSEEETLGHTAKDLNLWLEPGQRDHLVKGVGEKGIAQADIKMRRKTGESLEALMVATRFDLAGEPCMLSLAQDITKRKQAEAELVHSHELMDYIVSNLRGAVAVHDKDMKYIYVSDQYLSEYKVEEQDVIGKHHYDVFPDLPQKWRDVHQRVLAGAVEGNEKDPYYREDGSVDWTRWECRPWYEADGSIGGLIVYTEVITERVRAEEALKESESLLLQAQTVARVGHYVTDLRSGTWMSSEVMDDIFGIDSDFERTSQAWLDLVPMYMRQEMTDYFVEEVLGKKQPYDHEYPILRVSDGEERWIHGLGQLDLDEEGQPVRLFGTIQDITERKQAEATLFETELRSRNIIQSSPMGMHMYELQEDDSLVFVGANPAADLILSIDNTQFEGKTIEEAFPPLTQTEVPERYREAARDGTPWFTEQIEYDQGEIRGAFEVYAFQTEAKKMVALFNDVTGRKQAEEEQERLRDQLTQAQKMESVGRLAGGVAHDFNNMLGVIMGHAEIASEKIDAADPISADLEEIHKAARRSADLTRQLLAFARKQAVAPRVLQLQETIAGMLGMLNRLIGEGVELDLEAKADLWPVRIDPSQIDQILANLIVNARDAMGSIGNVNIIVENASFSESDIAEREGLAPGDYVMFAVSDTGSGMDKETLEHLFEPFFTTKGIAEGTGLGLATVYGIVKQNNGYIQVESETGQGTSIKIYLPRFVGSETGTEAKPDWEDTMGRGETVLLVEDEPTVLKMAGAMLKKLGYEVLSTASPLEALELVQEKGDTIQLLLTDVIMPKMSGRELADKIAVLKPHIKCLFMSGYTADIIAEHGVMDEDRHFIQKPFKSEDLALKLRGALE